MNCSLFSILLLSLSLGHVESHAQREIADPKEEQKHGRSVGVWQSHSSTAAIEEEPEKKRKRTHVLLIFSPFSSTVSSVHLSGST